MPTQSIELHRTVAEKNTPSSGSDHLRVTSRAEIVWVRHASLCICWLMAIIVATHACSAHADDKSLPVDARARELFKNLSDRFEAMSSLAVDTTTILETKQQDDDLPLRQVLRQRLSFRRPDGLSIRRLTGSAPVSETFFLKGKASLVIPGSGVIERSGIKMTTFLRSRWFGYEFRSKSSPIMDQNFAAVAIRDLLVRHKNDAWDKDVVGYEYLGQQGQGYEAVHGIRIFEEHASVGIVSAEVWMTEGARPRITRIRPNVEHLQKKLGKDADITMTAVFDAWDFSPTLTDRIFERPRSPSKVFKSLSSAMRDKMNSRREDIELRDRLIGKDASKLELTMLDGSTLKIADYVGKQPVLLDFWASWCSPCMQGLDDWQELLSEERFSHFEYVAVNQGETKAMVGSLQAEREWDFQIAVDTEREIGRQLEVHAIPQSVVIDKNGRVASVVFGLDNNNRVSVAAELDAVIGDAMSEDQIAKELRDRQVRVQGTVEKVFPSVVGLVVRDGGGSGVIVNKDGLILTAAHVTNRAGEKVHVYLSDGRRVMATSLGADHRRDAAMVKIDPPKTDSETDDPSNEAKEWPFAEISDEPLQLGEWVVAMGHPGGYALERSAPIRVGRVIKLADTDGIGKRFFATDCTITMGDSGGPAFDLNGRVIGIHSFISTRIEENMHVPMSAYKDNWERLREGKVWGRSVVADDGLDRAFLGVYFFETDKNGAQVERLVDGGPAAKAGIKPNDTIIAFGESKEIKTRNDIRNAKKRHRAGETVSIVVMRDNERIELDVTLGRVK